MILFNWDKIYDEAKGSVQECVIIFRMIVENQVPRNKRDRIYRYVDKDFSGTSWMLHPDVLLYNAYKYSYREIAEYIGLCALRPFANYVALRDTTLPVLAMPADPEHILDNNRLLRLDENGFVHFLYEEVNPKEIH